MEHRRQSTHGKPIDHHSSGAATAIPRRELLAEIEAGYIALHDGKIDVATDRFLSVAEAAPTIAAAWHGLALACESRAAAQDARRFLERACALEPAIALYWRDLGRVRLAMNDYPSAEAALGQALALVAGDTVALYLRGQAHYHQGRHAEAIDDLGKVLHAQPDSTSALNSLGNVMRAVSRLDEAIELYRTALRIDPRHAEAWHNLGAIHAIRQQWKEAAACEAEAVAHRPAFWQAFVGLGLALSQQKHYDDAKTFLDRAHAIAGDQPDILIELGNLAVGLGEGRKAIEWYRRAMDADPTYTGAMLNAASLLRLNGSIEEALALGRKVLSLEPGNASAHNLVGNCLGDLGMMPGALQAFQKAVEANPDERAAQSNLLYNLNFHRVFTRDQVARIHRAWGKREEEQVVPSRALPRAPMESGKRLRIGYVSGDFRRHSVMYFLAPILRRHSRTQFEVYCYSNLDREDDVTEEVKRMDVHWRDITAASDDEAASLIVRDRIDVLVDLAGHTGGNRLGIFARSPAPVQCSYLGYPNTTGLTAIDYRIVDSVTDPEGESERYHSETLARLDGPFLCFSPPLSDVPLRDTIPEDRNGFLTFGTFNNNKKINAEMACAWCMVLRNLPGAKLLLKGRAYRNHAAREAVLSLMAANGLSDDRIEFRLSQLSLEDHLRQYEDLDIALDTFPYNGTTTTFEALWMGVPTITWAGETHASRVGKSIMVHLGREQWVAESRGDYVRRCIDLARDVTQRRLQRTALRAHMKQSPLMQEQNFVARLEAFYRSASSRVCQRAAC